MPIKQAKGITLIALVITIIVLLILAGVAISMLTGENGILKQATSAKDTTDKSEFEEQVKLAVMASKVNDKGAIDLTTLEAEIGKIKGTEIIKNGTENNLPWTVKKGSYEVTITADGVTTNTTGKDEDIKIVNAKIATDAAGKNAATSNTKEGTTLYITFGATLENGIITKVIDNDGNKEMTASNGIYSKAVTQNGTYTFTITGTGENGEVTTTATVQVKEFENKIKPGTEISLTSTKGTTERFYVLSYDESTQKAKALAEWNLKVGANYDSSASKIADIPTTESGYGLQDSTMKGWLSGQQRNGTLAFSSSRYWNDTYTPQGSSRYPWVYNNKSNLYQYVEAYKTKLGNTDKVSEVSLASYEDIKALWSNKSNYKWLYSTSFWLGSANMASNNFVWYVETDGVFNYSRCYYNPSYGVRPVITIDMSKI